MKIYIHKGELQKKLCDVLIINAFEGVTEHDGETKLVNKAMNGLLAKVIKEEAFKAQLGQTLMIRTDGRIPAKRVLVVGLGKKKECSLETVREASAISYHAIRAMKPKKVVSILHGVGDGGLNAKEAAQAMVEGLRLSAYVFARYKKQKENRIGLFEIVSRDGCEVNAAKKGIEMGERYAQGTLYARDLVNTPAMHMRPIDLVTAAREISKKNKSVSVRVFDQSRLEAMGAGGILGVALGSDHPPYLAHLMYKPKTLTKKKIVLIGKAITFDSGGLSLKPADAMVTMKCDMAGAASVLGVFSVIEQVAPNVEVHGIFAPVENMVSGKAIRPGDILQSLSKKTVEVINTDAEGRLTLMDMLTYAQKLKPNAMIDLATLTGACVIALGEEITGVMTNDARLAQALLASASAVGEKMWEMPLEKSYQKMLKSNMADIQNIGGRWGGALTAGLFLQEFVDPKTPWAHLDIAGPAFAERDINAYIKKGGTGHGVRTLLRYLQYL
jgi:leucyl aminopeptidase